MMVTLWKPKMHGPSSSQDSCGAKNVGVQASTLVNQSSGFVDSVNNFNDYFLGQLPNDQQQTSFDVTAASSTTTGMFQQPSVAINEKTDFWRVPIISSSVRPPKRPLGRDSQESTEPQRKVLVTEDKMAARLRNVHITTGLDTVNNNWFFMQRPTENFEDIENRMSDEDDENHGDTGVTSRAVHIAPIESDDGMESSPFTVSSELGQLLAQDRARVTASTALLPNYCTDIILWTPPLSFAKEIVTSDSPEQSSVCENESDSALEVDGEPVVTFPSSPPIHQNGRSFYKRRNARQYSRPIIEELEDMTALNARLSMVNDSNVSTGPVEEASMEVL